MKVKILTIKKWFCYLIFYYFIISINFVYANIEIPSSPNPVGSGARAIGMGGAFIAVADDATAASWNPGGLIQLDKPELSIMYTILKRIEDNSIGILPDASGNQSINIDQINYLSFSYPFNLKYNMICSINYQHLYDFNRNWSFPVNLKSIDTTQNSFFHYNQEGSLSAIGTAFCIEMTNKFSFGISINIWNSWLDNNDWKQTSNENGQIEVVISEQLNIIDRYNYEIQREQEYFFKGYNANIGMLWEITNQLSFGAIYKLPFRGDLERHYSSFTTVKYPGLEPQFLPNNGVYNEKLDMPMSYGFGLTYRFSDNFTISADIYKTHWQDFIQRDSEGNEISPITGTLTSNADIDPTHQVRLGAEYLLIKSKCVIPLRCGLFYDPAPAQTSPDDYYGFSLGSGFWYGPYLYDIAYQYRFGNDVGDQLMKGYGFSQDVNEHSIYMSMIYHF